MAVMSRSVLVVDDDIAFRALAVRTLRSWGHVVVGEAGTFAEAVARTTELRPEAVLVDVGLPDGDGFSLAQLLSSLPLRPRVVLISADSDGADDAAARRVGAVGFVGKADLVGASLRGLLDSP
jgi:CheY-like chemotaxis protein